jgi:hypothetical protein
MRTPIQVGGLDLSLQTHIVWLFQTSAMFLDLCRWLQGAFDDAATVPGQTSIYDPALALAPPEPKQKVHIPFNGPSKYPRIDNTFAQSSRFVNIWNEDLSDQMMDDVPAEAMEEVQQVPV